MYLLCSTPLPQSNFMYISTNFDYLLVSAYSFRLRADELFSLLRNVTQMANDSDVLVDSRGQNIIYTRHNVDNINYKRRMIRPRLISFVFFIVCYSWARAWIINLLGIAMRRIR